jgi:hypothetical protein
LQVDPESVSPLKASRDAGSSIGFDSGSVGGVFADGGLGRDDHPPMYVYQLTLHGGPGDSLLAPGRRPVFVRRAVYTGNQSYVSIDRHAARLEYLEDLLGCHLELRRERLETMESPTVTSYMTGLGRIRAETIASYRRIEQALINLKLLTVEEAAGLYFEIAWGVLDLRADPKKVKPPEWPKTETIR